MTGSPVASRPGQCRRVTLALGRPSDAARQDRHEPVLQPEPDMQVEQFGQHRRGHVRVDMGRGDPGGDRKLDLRAELGFGRLGHQVRRSEASRARNTPRVDQPRRAAAVESAASGKPPLAGRASGAPRDRAPRRSTAASAISRNHGHGTMTEPHVTNPPRARVEKRAVRAVAHARSSICRTTRALPVRALLRASILLNEMAAAHDYLRFHQRFPRLSTLLWRGRG